ncbi:MAG: exodeoxyribonuclease V subunit alpha [Buchnera aphidicola (Periphyllus lyropictus)]|nr:exodeoxyribonuclease V subunit alpha [Buchnera aphidicola (Periphyllus lyropictus)]
MKKLLKKKHINIIDYYFAKTISNKSNSLLLIISSYLSLSNRHGKTFISLKNIKKKKFFNKKILKKIGKIKDIKKELLKSSSVGYKNKNYPLVIEKNRLYLSKIWNIEEKIFQFLTKKYKSKKYKYSKWKKIFSLKIFKNLNIEQKISIILCLLNKFTFILGSPGTGKTTLISKIIFFFIIISKKKKIVLTTPTGKSSSVLINSIKKNKIFLSIKNKYKKYIPNECFTIHRLFKINKKRKNILFKKKMKLNIDLLIIDETSMIDIFMLEKIINCINKKVQILFFGDVNQLPSINLGSILKDIIFLYKKKSHIKQFNKLKYFIKKKNNSNINNIFFENNIFVLKKKYRFKKKSDINICRKIIKYNKKKEIKKIYKNKFKKIKFFNLKKIKLYKKKIEGIFSYYKKFWKIIKKKKSIKKIFEFFNKIRILCLIKKGIFGIEGINKIFEKLIKKNIKIKFRKINKKNWYIGKPIIILKNSINMKLFNGITGITLFDKNKEMKVFFLMPDNQIKKIPINLIPKHKTTWAITIHKSQGSEFKKIHIIFPIKNKKKIINREIIYTALTRSKKKVFIYSNKKIFKKSIKRKIFKFNGLREKLKFFIKNLKK